jgi:hypothetical protein
MTTKTDAPHCYQFGCGFQVCRCRCRFCVTPEQAAERGAGARCDTTNADLIVDCVKLGYLHDTDMILDPTYGRGVWWRKWRPTRLVAHNRGDDGVDFRDLPYADGTFDAVAYDPPYVCIGGRKTSGIPDMHDRYGLTAAPRTPADLQQLINAGLSEAARVVKPRGIVLCKCQDYVSSGRLWIGTHLHAHARTRNRVRTH